jgi:hypothetical protein
VPSPEEARRLWKEGKTLEDWQEERRKDKKRKRKEKDR